MEKASILSIWIKEATKLGGEKVEICVLKLCLRFRQ